MTTPANAAVRERRRRSTPLDMEQMNIMKALTAAEYSRRQFVLNFAASKNTQLLIPGQKADAIKVAEEAVVIRLGQNGFDAVTNEFFKYTVDVQLWTALVGEDVEFPFSFMRRGVEGSRSVADSSYESDATKRPKSEAFLVDDSEVSPLEQVPVQQLQKVQSVKEELPEARRPRRMSQLLQPSTSPKQDGEQQQTHQSTTHSPPHRQRSTTTNRQSAIASAAAEKKRSLSLNSIDDLKMAKKLNQDRFPFLGRLGRSWSRRMS
ncbi:hypothetical protein B0H63DRAFT_1817 [Podospora didyma]|uniref:Uncharacterized protein n=1 Tax=Podospora didyma TaxID=330526 RepID=A0AAE0U6J2_9PEZI|nr:hypothetical protein B0H63DRAFT_1817 [Podospora didyma]